MNGLILIFVLILAAGTATAAPTGSFSAQYDGYAHGLLALRMTASLTLTPTGYSGRLAFHTAGLVGFMTHVESDSQVLGRFDGAAAAPESFSNTGVKGGEARSVAMHWQNGSPVLDAVTPPPADRAPVPEAMRAHTTDVLSAMALLERQAGATGGCDGTATTFDGRRVVRLTAHTGGHEAPPASAHAHYDAPAIRCEFEGTELAGFLRSEPEAEQRRPRRGTAWLAQPIPGAPLVPERVIFEHKILGQVTLYLTAVSGVPGPVAQAGAASRLQ